MTNSNALLICSQIWMAVAWMSKPTGYDEWMAYGLALLFLVGWFFKKD